MSFNKSNNNKKPFCKVCFDSGKTEKEYTSHYVKKLDGTVICPTLLSAECRFCHKKGHTVSKCPLAKKHDKMRTTSEKNSLTTEKKAPIQEKQEKKIKNQFAVLLSDDEDEDDDYEIENTNEKIDFPDLFKSVMKVSEPKPISTMNFKKILTESNTHKSFLPQITQQPKPMVAPTPAPIRTSMPIVIKQFNNRSWADDYSSDEGEDDYEIEEKEEKTINEAFVYNDAW